MNNCARRLFTVRFLRVVLRCVQLMVRLHAAQKRTASLAVSVVQRRHQGVDIDRATQRYGYALV